MLSALERRQEILEALNLRRFETIDRLASEFQVSRSTIRRDIETLSLSFPIYTKKGLHGGVLIDPQFHLYRCYLTPKQESLLRSLMTRLNDRDLHLMQGILDTFARPSSRI